MTWTPREYEEPAPRGKRRVVLLGISLLIVACAVVGGLWWWSFGAVDRIRAEIRARGEPATYAELAEYYQSPPADQDATELWLQAGRVWQSAAKSAEALGLPYFARESPPMPGQPWPTRTQSRQFLDDHAEALAQLHTAADLGGQARYATIDLSQSNQSLSIDHIVLFRHSVRALRLEAALCLHDGDKHGAARALAAGIYLARSLESEPTVLSQLLYITLFSAVATDVAAYLPVVDFTDEDLAALLVPLEGIDFARSARRGLVGDRVSGLEGFDKPQTVGVYGWKAMLASAARPADLGIFQQYLSDLIAATQLPWPETFVELDAIQARFGQQLAPWHVITRETAGADATAVNLLGRSEAVRSLLITAISLERFRRATGRPAEQLADLVPKYLAVLPNDPTTGKPFLYKAAADRYVVYSDTQRFPLGFNGSLDPETGSNPLLTFRWPARPAKPAADDADPDAQNSDEQVETP